MKKEIDFEEVKVFEEKLKDVLTICVIYAKANDQEKYFSIRKELEDDPAGLG